MASFPQQRGRRLRRTESLRRLQRESAVAASDLILPLFVVPGQGIRRPVPSMPGVDQTSVDELLRDAEEALALDLAGVILFGVPEVKDEIGSSGFAENGVVQTAVRTLKRELPELLVITDVCLCEYTSHGHCGALRGKEVDNDASLPLLSRMAVSHAAAGADVVAPSDMMDGRVGAIRKALDDAGHCIFRSSRTRRSTPRRSTGPFATRRRARRASVIGGAIRWIRRTATRRSVKRRRTSPREPTW